MIKCGRNGHRTLTVSESEALDRHDVVAATPGGNAEAPRIERHMRMPSHPPTPRRQPRRPLK